MSDDVVVLAFLERLVGDRRQGRILPLATYQSLYPGYDAALAEAYAGVESAQPSAAAGPAPEPPAATPNEQGEDAVGPYTLVRELGRGGQGIVYLARDVRVDRPVALKLLTAHGLGSTAVRRRFQREAAIASRLNHPNICTVYEADIENGVPYIAMQMVAGVSLARLVASAAATAAESKCVRIDDDRGAAASETERRTETPTGSGRRELMAVVELGEKVARALHFAHEMSIVHRDVKPGNIMVTASGEPLLMDFGLAATDSADEPTLTLTGDVVGTPAYMSPEQLAPDRGPVDRRTDVYSLGATLYECLTLTRPFDAPTRDGLYHQVLTHEPTSARRLNTKIPRELGVVLETALEKDRNRRYQTALDLAEELRRVRMHEPIRAKSAGPWLRLMRWAQRQPAAAAALLLTILFLAGLAGVYAWKSDEVSRKNDALQAALVRVSEESANARQEKERVTRLRDRRTQRLLVERAEELYPPGPDLIEPLQTWLADADTLLANLPSHRAALAEIELKAGPYTDAQKEQDHPEAWRQLLAVQQKMADLEAMQAHASTFERQEIAQTLQQFARERQALETRVSRRLTWPLGDTEAWLRELLTDLVLQLEALQKPDGLVADVRSRLARAGAIVRRTLEEPAEAWRAARARIRSSKRYGGLELAPQLGLIPLGPDPESGLEEFLHWLTHAPDHPLPQRDGSGRLPPMDGETGIVLVLLPGGTFVMGVTSQPAGPNHDPMTRPREGPPHEVTLDPFFIGKHELTRGQWVRLSGQRDPSHFTNRSSPIQPQDYARHPVAQVAWGLGRRELHRGDLVMPTEARWEYACRAGTDTPWSWGAKGHDFPAFANLGDEAFARLTGANKYVQGCDDGHGVTAPVGSYAPNPFGLYDMHGNVMEWCLDLVGPFSGGHRTGDGLLLQSDGTDERICRGGCLDNPPIEARSSNRPGFTQSRARTVFGVRAARNVAARRDR